MKPDFNKYPDKLIPAIVQDAGSGKVLMLGFMNDEAFRITLSGGKVCFFSRSRNQLWVKGETSGNFLLVKEVLTDCDNDTLLIKASPAGPVCHTGSDTCFDEQNTSFSLSKLEDIIRERKMNPHPDSYTSELYAKGINTIARKVGEEATELVIESKDDNRELFLNEAADLVFHFLVLLQAKDCDLHDVVDRLAKRQK